MYRMLVEKSDWDELVHNIVDKEKQIVELKKVLNSLCKELTMNIEYKVSPAYMDAQKYL